MLEDKKIILVQKSVFNANNEDLKNVLGEIKKLDSICNNKQLTIKEATKAIKVLVQYVDYINACVVGETMDTVTSHYSFGSPLPDNAWIYKLTKKEIEEFTGTLIDELECFKDDDAINRIINRNKVNLLNAADTELKRREAIKNNPDNLYLYKMSFDNMLNLNSLNSGISIHSEEQQSLHGLKYTLNKLKEASDYTEFIVDEDTKPKDEKTDIHFEPVILDYDRNIENHNIGVIKNTEENLKKVANILEKSRGICDGMTIIGAEGSKNTIDNLEFVSNEENMVKDVSTESTNDAVKTEETVLPNNDILKNVSYVEINSDDEFDLLKKHAGISYEIAPSTFYGTNSRGYFSTMVSIINIFHKDIVREVLIKVLGRQDVVTLDSLVNPDIKSTFYKNDMPIIGKIHKLELMGSGDVSDIDNMGCEINFLNLSKQFISLDVKSLLTHALVHYTYECERIPTNKAYLFGYEIFHNEGDGSTSLVATIKNNSASLMDMTKPFVDGVNRAVKAMLNKNITVEPSIRLTNDYEDVTLTLTLMDNDIIKTGETIKKENVVTKRDMSPLNRNKELTNFNSAVVLHNYDFLNLDVNRAVINDFEYLSEVFYVELTNVSEAKVIKDYYKNKIKGNLSVVSDMPFFGYNTRGRSSNFIAIKYFSGRKQIVKEMMSLLERKVNVFSPMDIITTNMVNGKLSSDIRVLSEIFSLNYNKTGKPSKIFTYELKMPESTKSSNASLFTLLLLHALTFYTNDKKFVEEYGVMEIILDIKNGEEVEVGGVHLTNGESYHLKVVSNINRADAQIEEEILKHLMFAVQEAHRDIKARHKTEFITTQYEVSEDGRFVFLNFANISKKNTDYSRMKNLGYGLKDENVTLCTGEKINKILNCFNLANNNRIFILPLSTIVKSDDMENIKDFLESVECENVKEYYIAKQDGHSALKHFLLVNYEFADLNVDELSEEEANKKIGASFKKNVLDKIDRKYLL